MEDHLFCPPRITRPPEVKKKTACGYRMSLRHPPAERKSFVVLESNNLSRPKLQGDNDAIGIPLNCGSMIQQSP